MPVRRHARGFGDAMVNDPAALAAARHARLFLLEIAIPLLIAADKARVEAEDSADE